MVERELALLYVKPHAVSRGAASEIGVFLERSGFITIENRRVVVTQELSNVLAEVTGQDAASLMGGGIFYILTHQSGDVRELLDSVVGDLKSVGTFRSMYGVTEQFNGVFQIYKPQFDDVYVHLEVWQRALMQSVSSGLESPLAEAEKVIRGLRLSEEAQEKEQEDDKE